LKHRASMKRFVSLQFLNLRHSVGLLGRVIGPSQGRYLTQTQNKRRQHPCLEWDSDPRSQRSSEQRQFMPYTARPLWPASKYYFQLILRERRVQKGCEK
jgi:hypothetical protein